MDDTGATESLLEVRINCVLPRSSYPRRGAQSCDSRADDQAGSRRWGCHERHHTVVSLVLHLHPKPEGSGVVVELVVPDHRAEIDERLKTIGQHRHQTSA